jgi:hypothetical protein
LFFLWLLLLHVRGGLMVFNSPHCSGLRRKMRSNGRCCHFLILLLLKISLYLYLSYFALCTRIQAAKIFAFELLYRCISAVFI